MSALRRQVFFLIAIPTILVLVAGFLSLNYSLTTMIQEGEDFSVHLYENQIMFEKIINLASAIQISQKVQQIPWQLYVMSQLLYHIMQEDVQVNTDFRPAIMNTQRTYSNEEGTEITKVAHTNNYRVSSWYNVDTLYFDQLSYLESSNLVQAAVLDTFVRPVSYMNMYKDIPTSENRTLSLNVTKRVLAFDYHGSTLSQFVNTTLFVVQNDYSPCEVHLFPTDVRCRTWYQYAKAIPHMTVFSPNFFISDMNAELAVSSIFCKHQADYANLAVRPTAILFMNCFELQLSELQHFFDGYTQTYSHQLVIDPFSLKIVFDTNSTFNTKNIFTLNQQLFNSLSNETSTNITNFIKTNYPTTVVASGSSALNIFIELSKQQHTYSFKDVNGSEFFMIGTSVCYIDQKKTTASGETRLANQMQVYLILDILFKDKLMEKTLDLNNKLNYFYTISQIGLSILILICLLYVFWISTYISRNIEVPINKLITIFKEMHLDPSQAHEIVSYTIEGNEQLMQIQAMSTIFQSEDAMILYETFSNLVKLLNFTARDLLSEDPSQMLLNLNEQILFFSQFKNYGSLGICHNNIANLHYFQGRHKQALQDYEKAIVYSKMQLELFLEEGMDQRKQEAARNMQKISEITRNKDVSKPISYKNLNNDSLIQSEIVMMSNRKEYFQSGNDRSNEMSMLLNSYLNLNYKEEKDKDIYSSNDKIKEEDREQEQKNQAHSQHLQSSQIQGNHKLSDNQYQTLHLSNFNDHYESLKQISNIQFSNNKDTNGQHNQGIQNDYSIQLKHKTLASSNLDENREKLFLLENLFNRKFNFYKCLLEYFLHFQEETACPFDYEFLTLIEELITINNYLDPSLGREIYLLQFCIQAQLKLNMDTQALQNYLILHRLLKKKKQEETEKLKIFKQLKFAPEQSVNYSSTLNQEKIKAGVVTTASAMKQHHPHQSQYFFPDDKNNSKIGLIQQKKSGQKIPIKRKDTQLSQSHAQNKRDSKALSVSHNANNFNKTKALKKSLNLDINPQLHKQNLNLPQSFHCLTPQDSFRFIEHSKQQQQQQQSQSQFKTLQNPHHSVDYSTTNYQRATLQKQSSINDHIPLKQLEPHKKNQISSAGQTPNQISHLLLQLPLKTKPFRIHSIDESYDFPTDVLASYAALCQSQFLIKNHRFYDAGLVLTENIENQQCFLQSARDQVYLKMQKIFQELSLQQSQLLKQIKIHNNQRIYKIGLVSLCRHQDQVRKTIVLAKDIIDTIMKRNDDQFGFLGYDFKEMHCESLISMVNCKLIKANYESIFQHILKSSKILSAEELNNTVESELNVNTGRSSNVLKNEDNYQDSPQIMKDSNSDNEKKKILPSGDGFSFELPHSQQKILIKHVGNDSFKVSDHNKPFFMPEPCNKSFKNISKFSEQSKVIDVLPSNTSLENKSKENLDDNNKNSNNNNKNTSINSQIYFSKLFHICVRNVLLNYFSGGSITQAKISSSCFVQKQKTTDISNKIKEIQTKKHDTPKIDGKDSQIHKLTLTQQKISFLEKLERKKFDLKSKLSIKKYLIVTLDQELIKTDESFDQLKKFLFYHQIEMIFLQLSSLINTLEHISNDDMDYQNKKVIHFFYSADKLLQFLNNQRQNSIKKHIVQTVERF